MKRFSSLALIVGLTTAASLTVLANAASGAGQSGLAATRAATAKYHSVDAALASGRVDLHLCVNQMGEHFADPKTFSDGVLDPSNPEAMVYAHGPNGKLQLVAVEWVSTTPGEVMDIPLHFNPAVDLWVLHAWIWALNPDGMFQDMNSRIGNCP